jgi:hypothetical protein
MMVALGRSNGVLLRLLVKVGDLVKVNRAYHDDYIVGTTIIAESMGRGFWGILWEGSKIVMHADYLEVISPALTDEQLEEVIGGMSAQNFSDWRAKRLNEGR